MVAHHEPLHFPPEAYLEWEKHQPIKHEYRDGDVYAMAGASDPHVTITGNLFALLRNHVRRGPCRAYFTDMKVRIESINRFYYPDILVTCDPGDRAEQYFKRYPVLIVEVLSGSTEAFDRGDKFADYRHLDSLQEYVLIDSSKMGIDCFRRNLEGQWVLHPFTKGDQVTLASLDFHCSMIDIYEDVELGQARQG